MDTDHSEEIGKIEAPTLIVWGDQDELIPRSEQDALTAAIASLRLEVYPGVGHGLHWDGMHFYPFQAQPAVRKSDEPLEDVVTSPNGFLSDKDSGGMFYVLRLI